MTRFSKLFNRFLLRGSQKRTLLVGNGGGRLQRLKLGAKTFGFLFKSSLLLLQRLWWQR